MSDPTMVFATGEFAERRRHWTAANERQAAVMVSDQDRTSDYASMVLFPPSTYAEGTAGVSNESRYVPVSHPEWPARTVADPWDYSASQNQWITEVGLLRGQDEQSSTSEQIIQVRPQSGIFTLHSHPTSTAAVKLLAALGIHDWRSNTPAMDALLAKLRRLGSFRRGWDGDSAVPISRVAIANARLLIEQLCLAIEGFGLPSDPHVPDVDPSPDGSLTLYWESPRGFAAIDLSEDATSQWYMRGQSLASHRGGALSVSEATPLTSDFVRGLLKTIWETVP